MSERYMDLEPSRDALEKWLAAIATFSFDFIEGAETHPATGPVGVEGAKIAQQVSTPIPEEPLAGGMTRALEILGEAVRASFNTMGPNYLAFVPGGGIPTAALADLASNCFNRFTGLAGAAPALARLESDVLVWLAGEMGFDSSLASGLLTTGGSMANLGAIVTAREVHLGEDADLREARAYVSDHTHHSVGKSFRLAGFPRKAVVAVASDSGFRMDLADLAERIREDRARGHAPFLVVASAGTTNTGAVDRLSELATLCRDENVWLHVDGAYGGAFALCSEGRSRLKGIELADSLSLDPHKGFFLPYGTGCLIVRDGAQLRAAFRGDAAYLQDFDQGEDARAATCPAEHGPELSRGYRGLRLWLPLMLHGAGAFRSALAEKLELAAFIHAGLERFIAAGMPIEIVAAPQLSIGAFRLTRLESEPLSDWNQRNEELMERINRRERVFLSSTALPVEDGSAFTLRTCVLSFRTHLKHVTTFLSELESCMVRPAPSDS